MPNIYPLTNLRDANLRTFEEPIGEKIRNSTGCRRKSDMARAEVYRQKRDQMVAPI